MFAYTLLFYILRLETNDALQESHISGGETTSSSRREYKRQYWEQHKAEINRRRRENRKLQQSMNLQLDEDFHIIEPVPITEGFIEQ